MTILGIRITNKIKTYIKGSVAQLALLIIILPVTMLIFSVIMPDIALDFIENTLDEIPIITVLAAYADGTTVIADAAELKVKESNRIDTMVTNLSKMGVDITGTDDGMIINGGHTLKGATIDSYMDHRIAMSCAVAALNAEGTTTITNSEYVEISYPDFFKDLMKLAQ